MDVHVTGCIRHDDDSRYLLASTHEHRCDSNLQIECMRQVMLGGSQLGTECWFIQLDNSAKDNKNGTVIGWCAYLVAMGLVDEIELAFMLVGHTHDDIDQVIVFSAAFTP
jgi:hypothetical protein